MRRLFVVLIALVGLLAAIPAQGVMYENVAEGKAVHLRGDAFFTEGWGAGLTVSASSVVDGVFLPRGTQWDQGAVWWDEYDGRKGSIVIDLDGFCLVDSLVVQADDNDAYIVRYETWDGGWRTAWEVPNYDAYGWGMQTRPDPADDGVRHFMPHPVWMTQIRVVADQDASFDLFFSVSEVQAYGVCY